MRIQDKLTKMRNKRGFTLVELMIVVAIIGVLSALAIYGVRKYLVNAKTAEARTALGRIAKDAQSAWERENMAGAPLQPGSNVGGARALCADGDAVPSDATLVENAKYQSSPADWAAGGWGCLKFTMDGPQYFQYSFDSSGVLGVDGETFDATANGAGNSLGGFRMSGELDDSAGELILLISPAIIEGDFSGGGGGSSSSSGST